jgi:hypothetical protein
LSTEYCLNMILSSHRGSFSVALRLRRKHGKRLRDLLKHCGGALDVVQALVCVLVGVPASGLQVIRLAHFLEGHARDVGPRPQPQHTLCPTLVVCRHVPPRRPAATATTATAAGAGAAGATATVTPPAPAGAAAAAAVVRRHSESTRICRRPAPFRFVSFRPVRSVSSTWMMAHPTIIWARRSVHVARVTCGSSGRSLGACSLGCAGGARVLISLARGHVLAHSCFQLRFLSQVSVRHVVMIQVLLELTNGPFVAIRSTPGYIKWQRVTVEPVPLGVGGRGGAVSNPERRFSSCSLVFFVQGLALIAAV